MSEFSFVMANTIVKVGAVQAEPVWLDLQGSVDKTISLIQQAGKNGVNVLGFPEVWIPGYPWYSCSTRHHESSITDEKQGHMDEERSREH